jgi:energy-coupling factor transporter ATP-binding protein EcfA2
MRLKSVHVTNYRSVVDSGLVAVDDISCFVGKNESGKTSFLMAVELLNPASGDRQIDIVRDYPAWLLSEGEKAMAAGKPPDLVAATYQLSDDERTEFEDFFGGGALTTTEPEVRLHYDTQHTWYFNSDAKAAVAHLLKQLGSPAALGSVETIEALTAAAATTDHEAPLNELLSKWSSPGKLRRSMVGWLDAHQPAFVYFGEYSLMPGRVSVPALITRQAQGDIDREFRTFLALLEIAGTPLESFQDDANYEQQKRRLEAAGIRITSDLNTFWSQNRDSSIEFDKSAADTTAEAELATGINLHVRSKGRRGVSVPIDEGSHGFRWFFSFLVYFTRVQDIHQDDQLVLLLDEPGSALHALAQADFLKVVEERLAPAAQVLYTTHSPFMVDANHLERVRLVIDDKEKGTIVTDKVLASDDRDTVFPLQAALGYSIGQTLFVAPNALLVEGPSDLLYLGLWSRALEEAGRTVLDPRWVIVPVGGVSKVETFVRLYGANQLHTAVLLDGTTKFQDQVERLVATGQLESRQIVSVSTSLDGQAEADIEDLMPPEFYVELVKAAFSRTAAAGLTAAALEGNGNPRLAKRVQATLEGWSFNGFDHLPPAIELSKSPEQYPLPDVVLDRAEKLFSTINACLQPSPAAPARKPAQKRAPKTS